MPFRSLNNRRVSPNYRWLIARFQYAALMVCAAAALAVFSGCATLPTPSRHAGPWNLDALEQAPAVTWGASTGLVQELYYQGEPLNEKPTRVFAYLARPST